VKFLVQLLDSIEEPVVLGDPSGHGASARIHCFGLEWKLSEKIKSAKMS
jgi:hypothetical protein